MGHEGANDGPAQDARAEHEKGQQPENVVPSRPRPPTYLRCLPGRLEHSRRRGGEYGKACAAGQRRRRAREESVSTSSHNAVPLRRLTSSAAPLEHSRRRGQQRGQACSGRTRRAKEGSATSDRGPFAVSPADLPSMPARSVGAHQTPRRAARTGLLRGRATSRRKVSDPRPCARPQAHVPTYLDRAQR